MIKILFVHIWFLLSFLIVAQSRNNSFSKTNPNQSQLFSIESGFFEDNIELEFNTKNEETIFYTNDGSEPNLDSQKILSYN